jgi:hypothetical protein
LRRIQLIAPCLRLLLLLLWWWLCCVQGKVSPTWFYVHIVLQLGGVVSGLGGFVIALLAFGWKDVPGEALYQPHKWIGIVVLAMALVQVSSADM